MMKKFLVVGAVLLAVVAILGAAGLAYAQTRTPGRGGFGSGMMGSGYGPGNGRGMMGGSSQGANGPLHTYFVEALAGALDMTPAQVQTLLDEGKTPWQIVHDTGLDDEASSKLLAEAHSAALVKAVADGVITQAQADWMKERMTWRLESGVGPGMMRAWSQGFEKGWMRGSRQGMMGGAGRGQGPVHTYFVNALAEALGLTPETVQDRIQAGETPWQIAASTGLNDEQVGAVLADAHSAALDQAVADGVITQDQADWMKQNMLYRLGDGLGPGGGGCHGGGRWNP